MNGELPTSCGWPPRQNLRQTLHFFRLFKDDHFFGGGVQDNKKQIMRMLGHLIFEPCFGVKILNYLLSSCQDFTVQSTRVCGGPFLHFLGSLSCAAPGLPLPPLLQHTMVRHSNTFNKKSRYLFQFNCCHFNLKVSDIQPVPDVRVWLFLLPLLHLEPDPLQPDELQVQEGLQGRPPLCPPTKSKGEIQNPGGLECPVFYLLFCYRRSSWWAQVGSNYRWRTSLNGKRSEKRRWPPSPPRYNFGQMM